MTSWVWTVAILMAVDGVTKLIQLTIYEAMKKPPIWAIALDIVGIVVMLVWLARIV